MRKFKFLILTLLSVLTLGLFVVTGSKVNAKGSNNITNTFTLDTADELPAANKNGGTGTGTSTATSGDTLSLLVTNKYYTNESGAGKSSNIGAYSSGKYLNTRSNQTTEYVSLKFSTRGAGSITLSTFKTQLADAYATIKLFSVGENDALTEVTYESSDIHGDIASKSGTNIKCSYSSAGTYDLRIFGHSSQTKNISCTSVIITETYNKVFYDINYNVGEHGVAPAKVEDKTSLTSSELVALADDGDWTFTGWYMDSSLSIPATTSVNLDDYDVDGDVTLYADWANANAKYTISFDSKGGSNVDSVEVFYDDNGNASLGTLMPSNPTKTGYKFAGWYTQDGSSNGEWGTRVLATSIVNESKTLYAKWVSSNQSSFSFDSYSNFSALPTENTDAYDEITLSDKVALVSGHGKSSSSGFTFSDNSEYKKFFQNANTKLTLTTSTKVTIYATQTGYKETHNRQLVIMDNQLNRLGYYLLDKTNVSNPSTYSIVLGAGEYNLLAYKNDLSETDGYFNLYAITFEEFETSPSVVFNCQYDTKDPSQATKIRFIAIMDDIIDPLLIDSVIFEITVGEVTKEFKCTQLYSSLSNKYSELGNGDGRIYAVYALTGIQSAISAGISFESLSVTVNFTLSSGLTAVTASHDSFTIGSYK